MTATDHRCAGVDGCRGGWMVATRRGVEVVPALSAVLAAHAHVGVDMPIGLPDDPPRASDRAARALLSPRGATVFPTPPRVALDASTHAEANALCRTHHGTGLSIQSFHLLPKIRELDVLVRALPPGERDSRLVEVHPECSFREMAGETLPSKHRAEGIAARRALIATHLGVTVDGAPSRGAGIDDVLDAYAALWSAERFAAGRHRVLPEHPARDGAGVLMRIVV